LESISIIWKGWPASWSLGESWWRRWESNPCPHCK